jgi:signal transduction histidine kinase
VRTVTEWLLLPLFLLPFAVGGGLLWLAADTHRREMEPFVHLGPLQARIWLGEAARWIPSGVERSMAKHLEPEGGWVDFTHPGGPGRVRLQPVELGDDPWVFTRAFPSGLLPEALADAGIRLQVETGTAPGALAGADPATTAFRRLYMERDLDRLRTAPLPATTKRFLLRRWRKTSPDDATLAEAERLLDVVADATATWPRPPGAHRIGELHVLAVDGPQPALVYPDEASLPPGITLQAARSSNDPIKLVWSFPPATRGADRTLWTGEIETPFAGHWRFINQDGIEWWRSARFQRWAGPVGAGLALFLLLPTALLVSIRRRRRLDELRVRFINELAHDLRTPLTSLRLYADMLAGGKSKEEDRGRYVDVIARESARMTSLLGNLLDLSRLEGHRRTFEPEVLALDEVAEHAIGDFVALYPKRADDIRVSGADDVRVTADRTALARCLGNLLDNAGKFTPAGAPVTLSWEAGGGHVRIVVADGGPGIADSERDRIFERYARGHAVKKDGVPGTGLGLSLVRELCRGMGGGLRLLPGTEGAAFEINLPGAG